MKEIKFLSFKREILIGERNQDKNEDILEMNSLNYSGVPLSTRGDNFIIINKGGTT